jgi:hypothetical protein
VRQRHGRDAIAAYIGNPAGHNTGLMLGCQSARNRDPGSARNIDPCVLGG